ncbi:MAG: segregation and condensation protein A [Gammaproteobacteria bacterium]|nr:segregation and condensation protein A [Gammaproteobacteria bacterium]
MDFEELSKDQKVLVVMRKTLASVIKDTTPGKGMVHPLSESTVEDIKLCLGLISAREREINEELGHPTFQPHFVDEEKHDSEGNEKEAQKQAQVIQFHPSPNKKD